MHTNTFTIGEATSAQAVEISSLYQLLTNSEDVRVLPERIEEIAADKHNYLYVAVLENQILGTALVSICLDAMYGFQPFAVIENIIVNPKNRKAGIGSALLNHIQAIALSFDCSKIFLLSANSRIEAHDLFKKHGFSASSKQGFVKYRHAFNRP
jgi:N-acetylglutamate synthase-like GNAT family acetyltransferase